MPGCSLAASLLRSRAAAPRSWGLRNAGCTGAPSKTSSARGKKGREGGRRSRASPPKAPPHPGLCWDALVRGGAGGSSPLPTLGRSRQSPQALDLLPLPSHPKAPGPYQPLPRAACSPPGRLGAGVWIRGMEQRQKPSPRSRRRWKRRPGRGCSCRSRRGARGGSRGTVPAAAFGTGCSKSRRPGRASAAPGA